MPLDDYLSIVPHGWSPKTGAKCTSVFKEASFPMKKNHYSLIESKGIKNTPAQKVMAASVK